MANPPFAGNLDNKEQIEIYDLGYNAKGKLQNKVGRDILFIERNLNFLKPGGRMAVVLPQGRFNNSGDKYIRDYIAERCRILAVVGLHGNVFKPHTGTKTSVLFLQKWTDENCGFPNICPKPPVDKNGKVDYPIFFATMQEPSKDNSGDKIYVTENYVTFPIFINYDKQDNISDTTKYEDHFAAENRLIAISKSGRSMDSEDVQNFLNATERGIDVQLFVRKNKDDKISKEFYYLGRVIATGNAKQFVMPNTDKTAVEIEWELETPVREDIYQYIVNE